MSSVSVIVPVYKVEPYLRRCVDSILNQTFSDFELILVDDGSPDNCPAICDEYAAKDPRVRVIHQENGGLSAARNAGIDWAFTNSESEWLSFVDSDDYVSDKYLQNLLYSAKKYNVSVSCCNYVEFEDGCYPTVKVVGQTEVLAMEVYWEKYPSPSVVAWGKLYRKELFFDVRYPIGKIWEDAFTTHKVLFQCKTVAWLSSMLYYYRNNQSSITHNMNLNQAIYRGDAYEAQVMFFQDRNYSELRNTAIRRMFYHTKQAALLAQKEADAEAIKRIKCDLLRRLDWAQNKLNIAVYANENIYESVIPFRARVSRKWRHFKMFLRKYVIRKK